MNAVQRAQIDVAHLAMTQRQQVIDKLEKNIADGTMTVEGNYFCKKVIKEHTDFINQTQEKWGVRLT